MNNTYSYEYTISIYELNRHICGNLAHGKRGDAKLAAIEILTGKISPDVYMRALRANKSFELPRTRVDEFIEAITDVKPSDPEKFLEGLCPPTQTVKRKYLDANQGQIEIITESTTNLIDKERFPIASRFAAVHVDKVKFFQSKSSAIEVAEGEYLRIEIPSGLNGAVILPVDQETGDVLLVTQFRHAPERFLTECPRGFGHIGVDQKEVHTVEPELITARRELFEETGKVPIKTADGVEQLFLLRSSYTDSGKLSERPSIYLAFVDRNSYTESTLRPSTPAMEDPVWIKLSRFIDALYTDDGVALSPEDFSFAQEAGHLEEMRKLTHLVQNDWLFIEDAFTIQAGLLALPRLQKRFGAL